MARNATLARRRPGAATAEWADIPAFMNGVNAQASLKELRPDEMIYSYNAVPGEEGLVTREGTREHARGLNDPKTFISFHDAEEAEVGTNDKIFVADADGIYDVTAGGLTPPQVLAWAIPSANAGYGVYTIFVNDAGDQFLLFADSVNGLHIYTQSTNTWAVATGITGIDVTRVRFVMIHKQRIWLCLEGDPDGWYLPINSIAGAAQQFLFGGNFPHGGDLAGLFSWTRDGGDGVDDYLLAVGRGGDVLAYRGEDPGQAVSWASSGRWYIGHIPAGRRFATDYGGEVYLLSVYGIITAGDLFRGLEVSDSQALVSARIARILRQRMKSEYNSRGWEITYNPNRNELIVGAPIPIGTRPIQYVMNVHRRAWGFWRDLPYQNFKDWNNSLYAVCVHGCVWRFEDGPDNVRLDDPDGSEIVPIQFSLLSSYQGFGEPAVWKIMDFLRPIYLSTREFPNRALAVVNYSLEEQGFTAENPLVGGSGGIWDTSLWDQAVWVGSASPLVDLEGASGMGLTFAIALQGEVQEQVVLVSVGASWRKGWFL